jgi:hypothetical protein
MHRALTRVAATVESLEIPKRGGRHTIFAPPYKGGSQSARAPRVKNAEFANAAHLVQRTIGTVDDLATTFVSP